MKRKMLLFSTTLVLSLAVITSTKPVIPRAEAAILQPAEVFHTVTFYRMQSPGNIHFEFLTADHKEWESLTGQQWYKYGHAGNVFFHQQPPGTVPLYRLVKNEYGDANHFYTVDKNEADAAVKYLGWTLEGVACFVSPTKVEGTTALYRFYRAPFKYDDGTQNGDQFDYTISPKEKYDDINLYGYQFQRVECYVWVLPTTLTKVDPIDTSKLPPPASMDEQLIQAGCSYGFDKPDVMTCTTQSGYELCRQYKQSGQLKVSACKTNVNQANFAKTQSDLTSRGCKQFLGRLEEYICSSSTGFHACENYRMDGFVKRCLQEKK